MSEELKSKKIAELETLLQEAESIVEPLQNRIILLEAQLASKADGWVSVETLPEMDVPVLVHTNLNYTGYGYRCDQTFWMLHGIGIADNVTHWQPLPTPPNQ